MKGLLIKDLCVLSKQMKVFLVLTLVFAVVQRTTTQGFALMYFSAMPVTALAYDEQTKWNAYAAMLPYRTKDLVLSKYVLGVVGCFGIFLVEIAASSVYVAVSGQLAGILMENVQMSAIFFCIALMLMSVNLPLVIRLGVEKGRYIWMFITIGVGVLIVGSVEMLPSVWQLPPLFYPVAAAAVVAVCLAVSARISIRFFNKRYR